MIAYIGYVLLVLGMFFILTSLVGMLRFKGFFAKVHAATISDSFGIPICLIGLACITDNHILTIKLILIAILYLLVSPASSHALVKSAWLNSDFNKNI
jgi:multicomponent Na+:H+ antiporter subunit G